MNHRALWAVLTIVASCGFNPLLAQPAQEVSERYVFAVSRLSIPKQLKGLKLVDIQSVPDGSNVINRFSNPMIGLDISLCVYTSPPDTKGPVLMLDSNGKEILEDREDEKNSHHAVFKLTTPSESYLQEYARVIKVISATGFLANPKLDSEFRFMAIPKRKDSPIGYAAELSGTRKLPGDESIPWTWKTYLYSIPGFFVKVHCTYPSSLWLDIGAIDIEFIQAINWDEIIPPEKRRATK